jgi:hypothetical protein
MDVSEQLTDAFDRVRHGVEQVLEGIDPGALTFRPDAEANTVAWLVWHLTRVQDDHVSHVAGTEQRWTADGWCERFDLPFEPSATGYGHGPGDVAAVEVGAELLFEYYEVVHHATLRYVGDLRPADLDRVVDERWDPPVTLGVRLVSVIEDELQHIGQASYVRGLAERAG